MNLDEKRVYDLLTEIMKPVAEHLKSGPAGPERNYEALNALAAATMLIISAAPTEADQRNAEQFFERALDTQWQDRQNPKTKAMNFYRHKDN